MKFRFTQEDLDRDMEATIKQQMEIGRAQTSVDPWCERCQRIHPVIVACSAYGGDPRDSAEASDGAKLGEPGFDYEQANRVLFDAYGDGVARLAGRWRAQTERLHDEAMRMQALVAAVRVVDELELGNATRRFAAEIYREATGREW